MTRGAVVALQAVPALRLASRDGSGAGGSGGLWSNSSSSSSSAASDGRFSSSVVRSTSATVRLLVVVRVRICV